MANGKEFPLSLVIRAVDKATAPLRAINARIQRFTGPVKGLSNKLRGLAEEAGLPEIAKGFKGVGSAAFKVGQEVFALGQRILTMAGVAGFALFSMVKGAIDAGDELAEMADRVGLNVDAYASLRFAAAQADIEQEAFNGAMDQFNKRLGEAKANGGPLLSFLKKVSPTLANQVKHAKSTESAFALMTDAMARIEDPGKRAALAAAAFGKSGLQMGNFLHQGSAAIQEQQLAYMRLSGSQEAFARQAGELDNVMREAETAFLGVRNALAAELFPIFRELLQGVRDFLADNRADLAGWARGVAEAIRDWVRGGGIQRLTAGFKKFIAIVDPIAQKLGGWPVVIGALAAAIAAAPLLASIAGLAAAFVSLGVAIGFTPIGWFLLGIAAIAAGGATIVSNWEGISGFFSTLWNSARLSAAGFTRFVEGVLTLDLARAWEGIKAIFLGGKNFITTLLAGLVEVVRRSFSVIVGPIGWVLEAAQARGENLPTFGGLFGADRAAPAPSAAPKSTEARVSVDFTNLPKGARVTPDNTSTAPLDLSLGYSMVGSP